MHDRFPQICSGWRSYGYENQWQPSRCMCLPLGHPPNHWTIFFLKFAINQRVCGNYICNIQAYAVFKQTTCGKTMFDPAWKVWLLFGHFWPLGTSLGSLCQRTLCCKPDVWFLWNPYETPSVGIFSSETFRVRGRAFDHSLISMKPASSQQTLFDLDQVYIFPASFLLLPCGAMNFWIFMNFPIEDHDAMLDCLELAGSRTKQQFGNEEQYLFQ